MKGLDEDQPETLLAPENRTEGRALVTASSPEERDLCHWNAPSHLPLGRANTTPQQHFAIELSASCSNKNLFGRRPPALHRP